MDELPQDIVDLLAAEKRQVLLREQFPKPDLPWEQKYFVLYPITSVGYLKECGQLQVTYYSDDQAVSTEMIPLDDTGLQGQQAFLWVHERCRLGTFNFAAGGDDRVSVDRFLDEIELHRPGMHHYYIAEPASVLIATYTASRARMP